MSTPSTRLSRGDRDELGDHPAERRLPAPRFTDEADGLARQDVKLTPSTAFTDEPTPALNAFTTSTTRSSGSTAGETVGLGATTVSVTDRLRHRYRHSTAGRARPVGWMPLAAPGLVSVMLPAPHLGVGALHGQPAGRTLLGATARAKATP